jgi:hypothetical protein
LSHFGTAKFSVAVGVESTDQFLAVRPPSSAWRLGTLANRLPVRGFRSRSRGRFGS